MAATFSEGQVLLVDRKKCSCGTFMNHDDAKYIRITSVHRQQYEILNANKRVIDSCRLCFDDFNDPSLIKSNTFMGNLLEKFSMLTMPEPLKTFVKAGVTDKDGSLTEEGQQLFLAYMLRQNGTAFKADVVDAIVADQAAEAKS